MEDPDRRRALSLTVDSTRRILSEDEVQTLRRYVIGNNVGGVALAMVERANNGMVLTQPEAAAIAKGFESQGEPFFHRFRAIHDDDTMPGVRDPVCVNQATRQFTSSCQCDKKECAECGCCAFLYENNKSAYAPPPLPPKKKEDCRCR
jgi:hypothetical protein